MRPFRSVDKHRDTPFPFSRTWKTGRTAKVASLSSKGRKINSVVHFLVLRFLTFFKKRKVKAMEIEGSKKP